MVGVDVFECRAAEFAAKRGIFYELPERLAPACRVAGQEPVLPMLDHAGESPRALATVGTTTSAASRYFTQLLHSLNALSASGARSMSVCTEALRVPAMAAKGPARFSGRSV